MSDDLLSELACAIDELIAAAHISDADLAAAAVLWSAKPADAEYLRACKAVVIGRMRLAFAHPAQIAAVEVLLAYEQATF